MSDEPINLAERREARQAPDADCVRRDEYGRPFYRFACEFMHSDGHEYGFDIWAYSMAEAEQMVESLNANGARLLGQMMGTKPA